MSEAVKEKKKDDVHYPVAEDLLAKRFRVVPSKLARASEPKPEKILIDFQNSRPVSKFLSKVIPYEFGASAYFRHRWLKGFRSQYRIGMQTLTGDPIKLQPVYSVPAQTVLPE